VAGLVGPETLPRGKTVIRAEYSTKDKKNQPIALIVLIAVLGLVAAAVGPLRELFALEFRQNHNQLAQGIVGSLPGIPTI
jgi:hypothetical protein